MWEGWTEQEVNDMIREVNLDINSMVNFHRQVLHSQFWLWTLVPVFGWISAPARWMYMQRNRRTYQSWAQSSRVALIGNDIVVVSLPQSCCTDPPQVVSEHHDVMSIRRHCDVNTRDFLCVLADVAA